MKSFVLISVFWFLLIGCISLGPDGDRVFVFHVKNETDGVLIVKYKFKDNRIWDVGMEPHSSTYMWHKKGEVIKSFQVYDEIHILYECIINKPIAIYILTKEKAVAIPPSKEADEWISRNKVEWTKPNAF